MASCRTPSAGPATRTSDPARGVDAVQADQLVGDTIDDLGRAGKAVGTPAERQNGDETSEHFGYVRCKTSGGAQVGCGYRFVC